MISRKTVAYRTTCVFMMVCALLVWKFNGVLEQYAFYYCKDALHYKTQDFKNIKSLMHLSNKSNPLHDSQDFQYCLVGDAFAQYGNQVLSLLNARISAQNLNTKVAIFSIGPFVNVLKNTLDIHDVLWEAWATRDPCSCLVHETWMHSFYNTFSFRKRNLYTHNFIPPLAPHLRYAAQQAMTHSNPDFTVHGRHFEGNCYFSTRHEHTPVPCLEFTHNLCTNYTLPTVRFLFNLTGSVLLLSDSQMPDQDQTYPVKDQNDFHIELWMMTISKVHVANPGSSDDFLIWLWKKTYFPHTVMHPKSCYPLK
jgi:hypothetical protein